MMSAVEVRDVWKRFTLRHNRVETLKGRALSLFHPSSRERREAFWALQGVTLDVAAGEALGIIGPNGSGKSTLLRLIAGILAPTRGRVDVRGRLSPMIEIGVGFNPELTGQENIFLNGSLLGLPRREIARLYPAIVEFAELGEFIDVPVKNYSTGMLARLGFSIAAQLDPDVLLVDEALSVGDAAFQQKCQERMRRLRAQRKTIILVSHSLSAVSGLCDRACLLVHGTVAAVGRPDDVLARYEAMTATDDALGPSLHGPHLAAPSGVAR